VGCALTDASEEFRASVEYFKKALRREGYEVFDFVGLVGDSSEEVYRWDIGHCVKDCEAFIAICDHPSLGLGYELAEAARLKKPILAVAQTDSRVTRLVLGAAEVVPHLRFERYKDINKDAVPLVNDWLKAISTSS